MQIHTDDYTGEVKKWNARTERHGDERVMAGDIGVVVNVPIDTVEQVPVDKVDFKKIFYKGDGALKATCLDKLTFHREYEDMTLKLTFEDDSELNLHAERVKKIVAELQPGYRALLSFQVQITVDEGESGAIHAATTAGGVMVSMSKGGQKDIEDAA